MSFRDSQALRVGCASGSADVGLSMAGPLAVGDLALSQTLLRVVARVASSVQSPYNLEIGPSGSCSMVLVSQHSRGRRCSVSLKGVFSISPTQSVRFLAWLEAFGGLGDLGVGALTISV